MVEHVLFRACKEHDYVMALWKLIGGSCELPIGPDDLVSKVIAPKHFIENESKKCIHTPIAMNIDARFLVQQIAHEDETLVQHRDERVRPASPGVAVGNLLEEVRLLVERLAADLDLHAEV